MYPFQEKEIVVVVSSHRFTNWDMRDLNAPMRIGKPNHGWIQPVQTAVNSSKPGAVWHSLMLLNGPPTRRQP